MPESSHDEQLGKRLTLNHIDLFHKAVDDCAQLAINYCAFDGKTSLWFADPLAVIEHNKAFYAVVGIRKNKTVMIFEFSRAISLKRTERRFDPAAYKFKIEAVHKDSFGVWLTEPKTIRIQFFRWAAIYVSERSWHPTQKIEKGKDGSIILIFKSGGLPEVQQWVFGFGAEAKVLEPDELKENIFKQACVIINEFNKDRNEKRHFEKHYSYKCLVDFSISREFGLLRLNPGDVIEVMENEFGFYLLKDGNRFYTDKSVLDELFEETAGTSTGK